jgi:ABC-2 type transport system permease protein
MGPRLVALIWKELLAMFRDPRGRFALIVPSILQLFLYAYAATLEVKNVPVGVLNEDWGLASQQLISRFERVSAFSEILSLRSLDEVRAAIDSQRAMAVVHIGQDFSRDLARGETASVQVLLDGRRSNAAQIVNGYIGAIVSEFVAERRRLAPAAGDSAVSVVVDRTWFNPNREYRTAMVPSLVGTLTMATVLMTVALSVARERELGTFEQLLVSPLQPMEIVLGKTVPGVLAGLIQGTLIIAVTVGVFGIPLRGSLPVLYAGLFVFLLAVTGVGLFVSSLASTQQQAMLGAMVYMVPGMTLSGFATPVQNMPDWLQPIALVNPLTHFLVIVRGVFLRDMPAALVAERLWPMALLAAFTLSAAAWMFKRKLQ